MKRKKKSFNHCKKDSRYSEEVTESYIGVLNVLSKSLKNTSERLHFGNVSANVTVVILKKRKTFSGIFQDFAYRLSCRHYRTAKKKKKQKK